MSISISYLRVLLALWVFSLHSGFYNDIVSFLHRPYQDDPDGAIAVVGFFTISGYLIHYILSYKYPSNSLGDFWHFFVSRFLRIYPLFFVVFLILLPFSGVYFTHLIFGLLIPFGIYEFFLSPVAPDKILSITSNYFGQTWTLGFDAVYYPLGFLVFKSKRFFYFLYTLLWVLFFAWWIFSKPQDWLSYFYFSFVHTLLCFLTGFLAFKINPPQKAFNKIFAFLSFITIVVLIYIPIYINEFLQDFISIIAFGIVVSELGKNRQSKYEKLLADFTFGFYLVHRPIITMLKTHILLEFILAFILALVFGLLIENKIIEPIRYKYINSTLHNHRQKISHITLPKLIYILTTAFILVASSYNIYILYTKYIKTSLHL